MALGGSQGSSSKTSQSAVKAGEAFVKLSADDSSAFDSIKRFGEKIKSVGSTIRKVGLGIAVAGAGMLAPLAGLFLGAVEHAANIDKLAQKLNSTAESVSALSYAAESSGIEINDFTQGMLKLNQAAINAEKGSLDQAVAFEQMGVSAQKFISMDVGEKLTKIVGTFEQMKDPMQQSAFLFKLFGEDANKLLPLFAKGTVGIAELTKEAERLGLVMNSDEAKKGRELHESMAGIFKAIKSTILEVGFALFGFNGEIKEGSKILTDALKNIREWIKENAMIIRIIALVAGGLIAAGLAVATFGMALSGIITVIGLVKSALLLLYTLALSPIVITLAAVAAGVYALYEAFDDFKDGVGAVKDFFVNAFNEMWDIFKTTFSGMMSALRSGNFELAFKILTKGLETLWYAAVLNIRKGWNSMIIWIVDTLKKNPWILPLLGGVLGGMVGGPAGVAAGALLGLGGAVALDAFEKEIKDALTVGTAEQEAKLAKAKAELKGLADEAKAGEMKVAEAKVDRPDLAYKRKQDMEALGDAVRGTFGSSDYRGTLGIGPANEIAKKQYAIQKQIRDELVKLNQKPGNQFK